MKMLFEIERGGFLKDSICISLLVLFNLMVTGQTYFWCRKMKKTGYKFCYTAPVGRAVIDILIIVLIVLAEIYYFFSGVTNMVLIVMLLFWVLFALPPKRYVFLGEKGIYIGRRHFSLHEQSEGQLIKDYPLHSGRVKIYSIRAKQKNSEMVLLSWKKLKMVWKGGEA